MERFSRSGSHIETEPSSPTRSNPLEGLEEFKGLEPHCQAREARACDGIVYAFEEIKDCLCFNDILY